MRLVPVRACLSLLLSSSVSLPEGVLGVQDKDKPLNPPVYVCACVCVCVRARVRACVRAWLVLSCVCKRRVQAAQPVCVCVLTLDSSCKLHVPDESE